MQFRTVGLACAFVGALTAGAGAQTVDEIITKNIEARGGAEKIKSVKTMKIDGKMAIGGGMEAPFTIQWSRPDHVRMELTIQGKTLIQAFDGETGWMIVPFTGSTDPEKMPEEELKQTKQQADMDGPLVDYKEKGHTVELVGKEDMEGTSAYKLKLTRKEGDVSYIFIDAESNLELMESMKVKREGGEIDIERLSADYKSIDGLVVAHSIEARAKGQQMGQTITLEKVELNPAVDEAIFKMPPMPAPAAK